MKLPGTQNSDSCSERNPKEHHETYGNTLFLLQEMLNLGVQNHINTSWDQGGSGSVTMDVPEIAGGRPKKRALALGK